MTDRPSVEAGACLREMTQWDALLWFLGRRQRWRVENVSMLPLLVPGDTILVDPRAYKHLPPQAGDIVVACPPTRPKLRAVKRIERVLPDGSVFLIGENLSQSTDSRTFGAIPRRSILGKVVCRFPA